MNINVGIIDQQVRGLSLRLRPQIEEALDKTLDDTLARSTAFVVLGASKTLEFIRSDPILRPCDVEMRLFDHDEPLAFYLVRNASLSGNKLRASGWQWRIYRDIEKLNVLSAPRYMVHYTWNALRKRRRYA